MADNQRGFMQGWIVGGRRGGKVRFAEVETLPLHGRVAAGAEYMYGGGLLCLGHNDLLKVSMPKIRRRIFWGFPQKQKSRRRAGAVR